MLNYQRVPKHIHWMQENTQVLDTHRVIKVHCQRFYVLEHSTHPDLKHLKRPCLENHLPNPQLPSITPMSFPYFSGDPWLFRLFEARQLRHVDAIDIGRRHIRLPSCTTEAAAAQVHRLEAEDSMGQAERMTSEVALVRCIATEKQQKYHIRYKSIYCTCVIMY